MWDALWAVLTALYPPRDTDPAVNRYRAAVSIVLVVTVMALAANIARCFGALSFIGLAGYANADAVTELKGQITELAKAQTDALNEIKTNQLDSKLLDDRKRQCAMARDNADARYLIEGRINWELEQYQRLSGQLYRLPDCSEF